MDAAACSLLLVAEQPCSDSLFDTPVSQIPEITIQGKSGTYKGVIVTMIRKPNTPDSCKESYPQLQYKISDSNYGAATFTSDTCLEESPVSGREWPCPIEIGGDALDLVDAFAQAITDGIEALENSFTTDNDLSDSIEDIKTEACGIDGVCTSVDLSDYLNKQLLNENL